MRSYRLISRAIRAAVLHASCMAATLLLSAISLCAAEKPAPAAEYYLLHERSDDSLRWDGIALFNSIVDSAGAEQQYEKRHNPIWRECGKDAKDQDPESVDENL